MNGSTAVTPLDQNVAQVLRGFEARLQHLEQRVHSLEIGDAHGTQLIQSIYDDLIIEDEKEMSHTPAPSPNFAIKEEESALLSPPPQLNAFLPPLPPSFLLSTSSTVHLHYSRAEIVGVGQAVSSGLNGVVKKLQTAIPVDVSHPKQPSLNVTIDNMNRSSSPEWERSVGRSKSFERSHSSSQDSATFQHYLREYQHQQKRLAGDNVQGGTQQKQQSRQHQAQQKESSRPPRANSNTAGQQSSQQQKRSGHHHRTVTRTSNNAKAPAMDTMADPSLTHSELRFGMLVQVPDSDSETP